MIILMIDWNKTLNNQYNENSIQKLDPLSFTRLRPDTYCGSTEDSTQLVVELITNCKDEFLIGNCNEVYITINEQENIITVSDTGQGIIPNLFKEDNKTVLEMVYGDINTSGKYDKSENAVYKESTGAFGIGASLSNFLSHWLTATTKRDGQYETVYFIEGKFDHRESGQCPKEEHGVSVSLKPSEEFFKDARPNKKSLQKMLYYDSCVCPGLKYIFNGEEFYHPNGLQDLINSNDIELTNFFSINIVKDRQKFDLVLVYVPQSKTEIIPFCNYALIEAGTPITTIKSILTRTLNKWAKEQGILKSKDRNLEGAALQEGLRLVFNLSSPNIRYDSQTKVRVTSTEDNSFISSTLGEQLEIWLDNNVEDGKNIIEKALVARKAAEAAKKARERVKAKAVAPVKKKMMDMPSKLADCYEKDRSLCELYLTEGDSASGGCKTIRDSATQAILGLRGKVLNTMTSTPESWHKNQEIMNIVQALGFSWSSDGKNVIYDENKLRYDKFVIAADRDPDGSHIQSLILAMVWTLFPDLLINGHVYVALPPLYKAEWGTQYQYIDNKKALEEFKKTHKGKFTLTYFKGLGEASPQELGTMIMDPATRNLQKVEVDDIGLFDKVINNLMGKSSIPKKEFVFNRAVKEVL